MGYIGLTRRFHIDPPIGLYGNAHLRLKSYFRSFYFVFGMWKLYVSSNNTLNRLLMLKLV